jgi:NAD(P)-dependent dehydrogenase (short-subunit alcohol dehydrogenase family)
MDLGLDGRVYLVTGGSRGLGFAAAQALVADGARVVLSAPHEGTASSAVARLAQNAAAAEPAAWVIADNADPATPGRLIAAARDRFGRLDGALISVGGSPSGTVATTTTDETWRSAFESVFLGAVRRPGSWRQIWAARATAVRRAAPSRGRVARSFLCWLRRCGCRWRSWLLPTGCSRGWPGW